MTDRKQVFIEKIMPVKLLNEQVYYEHGGNPFKGLHRWYSRKPLSFSRASVLASLLPDSVTMKAAMEYPLKFGADLQQDIDKWVKWVGDEAEKRLAEFFPSLDGEKVQNYLWAHTVVCPSCESVVPLSPNWWLDRSPSAQKKGQWCAVKPVPNLKQKRVDFELVKGKKSGAKGILSLPLTTSVKSIPVGQASSLSNQDISNSNQDINLNPVPVEQSSSLSSQEINNSNQDINQDINQDNSLDVNVGDVVVNDRQDACPTGMMDDG